MHYTGKYKGVQFRSLLEYSFYKLLESEGLDIRADVRYENFKIAYIDPKGKIRNYIPDVFVPSRKAVYELKYANQVFDPKNKKKAGAAKLMLEASGISYQYVTENDLKVYTAFEANKDPDLQWTGSSIWRIERLLKRKARRDARKRTKKKPA